MENSISRKSAELLEKMGWYALLAIALYVIVQLGTQVALADSGSDIFGDIKKLLEDYLKGTLGVIFALLILLVGVTRSIMTGSLFYLIVSLGTCIVLYYAPTVIESLMDSTLTDVDAITTLPIITD